MTLTRRSPGSALLALSLLILTILSVSTTVTAKGRRSAARSTRARAERKRDVRTARVDRRHGKLSRAEKRLLAKESRRDRRRGHVSVRESRADRRRAARQEAALLRSLERKRGRPLSKRERRAEIARLAAQRRREIEEARRRAEAARLAAIARQRALDESLRNEAAANITNDSTAGEDLEVRKAAIEALGHHAGTVVVMDPSTGRVYTVVNQEWALRRGFKPCSTIKLVTGVAGLCERIIQPTSMVSDSPRYRLDLTDALAYSNNSYFQSVGGQVGFDKIVSYAREMGLGERTGINYANESPGRVPLFKTGYAVNHMCSHGDDFEVTPIQLATLVAAMANGGKLLVPHVPRTPQEDVRFKTTMRRQINVNEDAWRRMVPGMIGAVNYGSGKKAYRPEQTVAGKTGTCIGQGSWLGLFTSYAPVANPRLAVVVVARGSDGRNHLPAAVAGSIYRALSPRFGTPINLQIATAPDSGSPDRKAGKKANVLNEEDAEAAAAEAEETTDTTAEGGVAAPAGAGSTAPAGPVTESPRGSVKSTIMTFPSKRSVGAPVPAKSVTVPAPKPQVDDRPRRIAPAQP
ncbi:MAG TPA: penicillin-binding transpeptidase domain-containing protein [Pyrinomonadaceae bacterium]